MHTIKNNTLIEKLEAMNAQLFYIVFPEKKNECQP